MGQYTEVIYIDNNGDDYSGNGTIIKPYKTISHAMSQITTTSPLIEIGEGEYQIQTMQSLGKANVHMTYRGQYNNTTIIVSSSVLGKYAGTVDVISMIIRPSDTMSSGTNVLSYTNDSMTVNFYNCVFLKSKNDKYPTSHLMNTHNNNASFNSNKNFYNCTIIGFQKTGGSGVVYFHNCAMINCEIASHHKAEDCLDNDENITIDENYFLSAHNNLYGVYSGEYKWFNVLCLILKDNKYYSVLEQYYNGNTYEEISKETVLSDFDNVGFDYKDLFSEVTIEDETFRPIDKFDGKIKFVFNRQQDVELANVNVLIAGLKSNIELILPSGHFTTRLAENIDYFDLIYTAIGTSDIKCAISDDFGVTWKTWDKVSWNWKTLTSSPTLKKYNELSQDELVIYENFKQEVYTNGFVPSEEFGIDYNVLGKNLMFAYVLTRPTYKEDVSMTTLQYQFDARGHFQKVDSDIVDITQNENVITVTPSEDISLLKINIGSSGNINVYSETSSENIAFNNENVSSSATNIQEAIEELYRLINNGQI